MVTMWGVHGGFTLTTVDMPSQASHGYTQPLVSRGHARFTGFTPQGFTFAPPSIEGGNAPRPTKTKENTMESEGMTNWENAEYWLAQAGGHGDPVQHAIAYALLTLVETIGGKCRHCEARIHDREHPQL